MIVETRGTQVAPHFSFLDDAEARFLEAFALFEKVNSMEPEKRPLEPLVQSVRALHLAIEKGLKHAVAIIDPYLLLVKPERALLVDLRKDLLARPVPSIFCSRIRLETIGIAQTWDTLRSLSPANVDEQMVADFDRALRRLVDTRNRAQHAELLDEVEEVRATIEQVLARFTAVVGAWVPDWLDRLYERNGQLESRLRAIENEVDASWQVLIDNLRADGGFKMSIDFYAVNELENDTVRVVFGGADKANNMLGGGDVPRSLASGLFQSFLTDQQASDRYAERQRLKSLAAPVDAGSKALAPLDEGVISVPSTSAWLSLFLPNVTPHQLHVSATLTQLRVEFPRGSSVKGSVGGRLECTVQKGTACAEAVQVSGTAYFTSEWNVDADLNADPPEPARTQRCLSLELELTVA